MRNRFFVIVLLVLVIPAINALPPIDDLINALGRPVPTVAERVNMNQYAKLISYSNVLTVQQSYVAYSGVVTESSYLWAGDVERISWEIWDYLESLDKLTQKDNYFTVSKNGYRYILFPIKKNDSGKDIVQLTVIYD